MFDVVTFSRSLLREKSDFFFFVLAFVLPVSERNAKICIGRSSQNMRKKSCKREYVTPVCHCLVTWNNYIATIPSKCWLMIHVTKDPCYGTLLNAHYLANSIIMAKGKPLLPVVPLCWLLYRGHQSIQATKPKEIFGHTALSCGTGRGFSGSLINGATTNPEICTMYASPFLSAQQFC